jgi:hypothetical protein
LGLEERLAVNDVTALQVGTQDCPFKLPLKMRKEKIKKTIRFFRVVDSVLMRQLDG